MFPMTAKNIDIETLLGAVGREIMAERVRRSWSRKDLAVRAQVSESQVGKIERGERGQIAEMWRIADALDVVFSELVGNAERAVNS